MKVLEIAHLDAGPVTSRVGESNHHPALRREWLDVNGRGGYASSTLLNCHTRKYHGLLVSRLAAPPGRYILLSKFEDTFSCGTRQYPLTCHQYPQSFFPEGYRLLKTFQQDVCPVFIYEGEGVRIRKSLMMVGEEDCLLVRYDLDACPAPGVLRLLPFLAFRDYHRLSRENSFLRGKTLTVKNGFSIRPYAGMPPSSSRRISNRTGESGPYGTMPLNMPRKLSGAMSIMRTSFAPACLRFPCGKGKR